MTHPTKEAISNGMTNHELLNYKLDQLITDVKSVNICLNGNPDNKDDFGMKGEQIVLRKAYKEAKEERKWANRIVGGFVLLGVAEFVWTHLLLGG